MKIELSCKHHKRKKNASNPSIQRNTLLIFWSMSSQTFFSMNVDEERITPSK